MPIFGTVSLVKHGQHRTKELLAKFCPLQAQLRSNRSVSVTIDCSLCKLWSLRNQLLKTVQLDLKL